MAYKTIIYEKKDRIGYITFNRPEVLNSLDPVMISELHEVIGEIEKDDEVRAVILTGTGRAFIAGGDINWLLKGTQAPFELYMQHLFASSKKFIIIYSNDTDNNKFLGYPHIKSRKFSDWIIQNAPEWKLIERIPNKYPYEGPGKSGSWCDFFIYEKANA